MPVVAMGIGFNTPSDGQVINGVAHFVRPTAPTVRNDGSALQDNDRWYDSSTGRQWIRKGIYWCGERNIIGARFASNNLIISATTSIDIRLIPSAIYAEKITYTIFFQDMTQTVDDYYLINSGVNNSSAPEIPNNLINDNLIGLGKATTTLTTNIENAFFGSGIQKWSFVATKIGSATNRIRIAPIFIYREIYA